ncbi:MAG: divalent cation tolerance protein CutA [Pantoea sp.]|uniref:Divalent-cation tolerance protein CutA n=1 Tax=Pantoea phytobeneficialis TaxID=2052056 RepID=A0AAP9H2D5_9GAMM|nr:MULTISPECIES: divalent cation tolerance protein CutA [Pantoea]ERK15174.1 Periplasmic divalent cation tolerance protein CutA [Pantoea sp. AS-PWVM4]MDO6405817.1 divalent cation tolerance protein CutA [Pantoea phytobeneficialis]QGR05288.1 divalent cation tolerance protein CutA [Pantoea phytobeneficialis]
MHTHSAVIVLCTAPDQTCAEQLAASALAAKLAACVTLLPGATSFYVWEGKLEQSSEVQMLLKSDTQHQQALMDLLKAAHPYDVPELLALPVQHGDSEYLSWLHASLA